VAWEIPEMSDLNTRSVIDRYAQAMASHDLETLAALFHEDYVEDYPQSGERIRGAANLRAMLAAYPGGEPRSGKVDHIVGSEDSWVVSPSFSPMRIEGTGDQYTVVAHITYPDGSEWHEIALVRLKDGRIHRITAYFAAPFDAPEWRIPFVEHGERG
jgi:ketosteroid isomerase-like protein